MFLEELSILGLFLQKFLTLKLSNKMGKQSQYNIKWKNQISTKICAL